jgi:serine/threonine protein kinase
MNIGRYEVIKELGQGGMAIVYLAHDPNIKRQVAIKVLPRQFTFEPQFRARFQHEVEVIARLENAAIVPVYDSGEHEDQPFIVMRYMPGGTLADRLEKGPLPLTEIDPLFQRIGSALDYAHRSGVVHRDMKPGNILFDSQGEAFLSDFGIAKLAEASVAFTGTGSMVGTPAYMSPEQALGEKNVDGRSDIYSLGVVLFEALSGQLPFNSDTPMGVAIAHIQEPVPSLLDRNPNLPRPFEAVIRKTMEKRPADRYQTAGELSHAIRSVGKSSAQGTMVEQPKGTALEPARGTVVEPISGIGIEPQTSTNRPYTPAPNHYSPTPPAPVSKNTTLPKLLGGVGILAVCFCVVLTGVFASRLLPGLFATPSTQVSAETPLAQVTNEPIPTNEPAPTAFVPIVPDIEIASEGTVDASSIYDSTFPAALAIDGDPTTSWFSAGPDEDGITRYVWTGVQEDFIATIDLISNQDNEAVEFRTGYGFESVLIQVYDAQDQLAYEETVSLTGTPDPYIQITPNVVGQWIWILFSGSESPDRGGFSELKVGVVR